MKKRRLTNLALAGVLAAGAVLAVLLLWPSSEPLFQGKPVSRLLERGNLTSRDYPEFRDALQLAGTNAIPVLLRMIQATDRDLSYRLRFKVNTWLNRQGFTQFRFSLTQPEMLRHSALTGFLVLGHDAAGAVPALGRLLTNTNIAQEVGEALAYIEPEGRRFLRARLTNQDPNIRLASLFFLSEFTLNVGTATGVELPSRCWASADADVLRSEVINRLTDEDPRVRTAAERLLGTYLSYTNEQTRLRLEFAQMTSPQPEVSLPALRRFFNGHNPAGQVGVALRADKPDPEVVKAAIREVELYLRSWGYLDTNQSQTPRK